MISIYGLYGGDCLIYTGQTSQFLAKRLRGHMSLSVRPYGNGNNYKTRIARWIRKHGKPCVALLAVASTCAEADRLERYYIAANTGLLNMSPGGWDGLRGVKRPEHSAKMKGRPNPAVREASKRYWTPERRAAKSEYMKGNTHFKDYFDSGAPRPKGMLGKHHTPEVRARISATNKVLANGIRGVPLSLATRAKLSAGWAARKQRIAASVAA